MLQDLLFQCLEIPIQNLRSLQRESNAIYVHIANMQLLQDSLINSINIIGLLHKREWKKNSKASCEGNWHFTYIYIKDKTTMYCAARRDEMQYVWTSLTETNGLCFRSLKCLIVDKCFGTDNQPWSFSEAADKYRPLGVPTMLGEHHQHWGSGSFRGEGVWVLLLRFLVMTFQCYRNASFDVTSLLFY